MKICIALHSCMDLGGIINHTEQLIGGLQDLGHSAELFELAYTDNAPGQGKSGTFEVILSKALLTSCVDVRC